MRKLYFHKVTSTQCAYSAHVQMLLIFNNQNLVLNIFNYNKITIYLLCTKHCVLILYIRKYHALNNYLIRSLCTLNRRQSSNKYYYAIYSRITNHIVPLISYEIIFKPQSGL